MAKKFQTISTSASSLFPLLALSVFSFVLFQSAWLAEDAFISFRTIDNFLNGYGLRWNITERVQTFTHPLWVLLISLLSFFTREIPYSVLALSLVVSFSTIYILAYKLGATWQNATICLVLLTCSKAFVDFSTSGLANPLTHLLIIVFVAEYRLVTQKNKSLYLLSFIACLATLNRIDILLILLPALIMAWWHQRSRRALFEVATGFTPFVCWEIFSLLYYGFLIPNTAYAKLNTGIPLAELVERGSWYIINSSLLDPLTLTGIGIGIILPIAQRNVRDRPLSVGIALYMSYIIWIGGDFMSGRFLSSPLITATAILATSINLNRTQTFVGITGILIVSFTLPRSPLLSNSEYGQHIDEPIDTHHISDERALFYPHTGLVPMLTETPQKHSWATRGRAVREQGTDYWKYFIEDGKVVREGYLVQRASSGMLVTTWSNIGLSGFYAGPKVHIIDSIALADPLLSRLPAIDNPQWGPGHFGRIMPAGYIESFLNDHNQIADPNLGLYYEALAHVIRGNLLSSDRLLEIWRLNTGYYDHLINTRAYRFPSELEKALSMVRIRPETPTKLLVLAEELFVADEDAQAISTLNSALSNNPHSAANHSTAGRLFLTHGYYTMANKAFLQAIELAGDSSSQDQAEFYNGLGTSLLRLDRMAESEEAFIAASKLAEDNWQSCYNIAVIRIKLLDYRGAIPALSKAIDRGMGVKTAIGLGRILVRFEDTDIADLYQRILAQPDLMEEDRQMLNKELQVLTQ